MPVNLRTLISTIKAGTGDITPEPALSFEYIGAFNFTDGASTAPSYGQNYFWYCVPSSVTRSRIEIWGGGGGGGPARCCTIGIPGNAGAYARKCMTGLTAGTCYLACSGYICGYGNTSTRGFNGSPICMCGTGLTNFYANGGCGGLEWCMAHANACYVGNVIYNMDVISTGNVVCTTWGIGADTGCYGLPGFIRRMNTGSGADDYCVFRFFNPYPAFADALYSSKGGYVSSCIINDNHGFGGNDTSMGFNAPTCHVFDGYCGNLNAWAGMGKPGGSAKSGGCYCGSTPSATKLRISLY